MPHPTHHLFLAYRMPQKAMTAGESELAANCLGVCNSVLHTLVQNGCELDSWMSQLYQQLQQLLPGSSMGESV